MAEPAPRGKSSGGRNNGGEQPVPTRELEPFASVSDPVLAASLAVTAPAAYGPRRVSGGSGIPPPPPQVLRGSSGSGLVQSGRNQTATGPVRQTSTGSGGPFAAAASSPLLAVGNRPGALDSNIMRAWSGGGAAASAGNGALMGSLVGSFLGGSSDSVGGGLGSSTADPRFLSPQMSNNPLLSSASSGISLAPIAPSAPAGGKPRHRKTQSYNGSPTGSPFSGVILPATLQASQSVSSRGSTSGQLPSRISMSSRTSSVDGASIPLSPSTSVADFDYRASSSSLVTSAVTGPDPENADGVTSSIHDAARIANWDLVRSLCEKEPLSAQYRGHQGWTALHHTCSRRCPYPEVVEALLGAYPGGLLDLNFLGWTPLHYAARSKASPGVVQILLHAFPDIGLSAAAKRCPAGRSPLYYAVRYEAADEVVEMLLEADPGAALDVDRDLVSPLGLIWDTYISSHEGRKAIAPYTRNLFGDGGSIDSQIDVTKELTATPPSNPRKLNKKIEGRWVKANKMLRGFFRFPVGDDFEEDSCRDKDDYKKLSELGTPKTGRKKRKWRILHAAAASGCHVTLFQLACVLHPEQALEFDEEDLYGTSEGTSKTAAFPSFTATASSAASVDETSSPVRKTTALHFAASSPKQGLTEIKTLLKLNKDAASFKEEGGSEALPLHLIAENEHKTHWIHDGVKDVYQGYPEGIYTQDGRGRTPLHCAASVISSRLVPRGDSGPSSPVATAPSPRPVPSTAAETGSIVQALVNMHAQAAKTPDKAGRLPLHYVAQHGEGWNKDAEAILAAFPEAVRHRAGPAFQRRLPLHMAATGQDAKLSLIQALVAAHPRGAAAGDSDGRLPLHLACESGKTWESGFAAIYEAYPPALREREGGSSGRGWTPLHILCDSPNDAVAGPLIRKIVQELSPEAASVTDRKSRYPLHVACASGKTWDDGGIGALFQAHPQAAFEVDANGLLPLHAAALALCSSIEEAAKSAAVAAPVEDHSVYVQPPPPPPPSRSLSRGDSGTVGSTPATPARSTGNSTVGYEDDIGDDDDGDELNDDDIDERERSVDAAAAAELAKVDTLYRLLHAAPHIL